MLSTIENGADTRLRFRLKTDGVTSTLIASSGNLPRTPGCMLAAVYDGASMLPLLRTAALVGSTGKTGNSLHQRCGSGLDRRQPAERDGAALGRSDRRGADLRPRAVRHRDKSPSAAKRLLDLSRRVRVGEPERLVDQEAVTRPLWTPQPIVDRIFPPPLSIQRVTCDA